MEIGFKNCQHTPRPQTNDCLGAETLVRLPKIILEGSTTWTTMLTLSYIISVDPTLPNKPDHYDLALLEIMEMVLISLYAIIRYIITRSKSWPIIECLLCSMGFHHFVFSTCFLICLLNYKMSILHYEKYKHLESLEMDC